MRFGDAWWKAVRGPDFDPKDPIWHVVRRGERSFCGAVSASRGGWLITPETVPDEARVPSRAVCVPCLRAMRGTVEPCPHRRSFCAPGNRCLGCSAGQTREEDE